MKRDSTGEKQDEDEECVDSATNMGKCSNRITMNLFKIINFCQLISPIVNYINYRSNRWWWIVDVICEVVAMSAALIKTIGVVDFDHDNGKPKCLI